MTPLVAGIALTGKAPVYENVYMSGLKQKAAGEAAKAKQLSDAEKEYQKALGAGSDKVVPSLAKKHEKVGLAFLVDAQETLSNNPVNGMNQVSRKFVQAKEILNNFIQQSDEIRKRFAPGYYKEFLPPTKLLAALQSTRDIEEAYNDPNSGLQQEAAKLGYELSFDPSGRLAIAFNDIPKEDVVKKYFDWQRKTVYDSDPTLGNKFTLGRAKRQEIERVVTPQASESVLSSLSGNRVFAANWDALGYDVTTPTGRTRIYNDYLAPKVDSFTSGPGMSFSLGGGTIAGDTTVSAIDSNADASFGWDVEPKRDASGNAIAGRFKLSKDGIFATDEKGQPKEFASVSDAENWKKENATKTISGDALQVGYEASSLTPVGAFYVGERTSRTKFGAKVEGNTINAKVNRLETVPVYTGDAPMQFGMFVLTKGVAIPSDILAAKPDIKNEKKLFIVAEGGRVVGSDGKETTTGATIYVPANKANLGAVLKGIPAGDKGLRAKIEALIKGAQKLGGAGPIGAAGKQTGAEAPQSTFNLLDIPTA